MSTLSKNFSGSVLVENLSKSYPMRTGPGSMALKFNEVVARKIARFFTPSQWGKQSGYFWALQDVSFEIQPGELIGLVGHNGSGKSTLLKLLARVTKPTGGRAFLRGRVGSLLEVGTGFHPELTGFENIYLCGTILGMSRAEVTKKFDEIVAFSEVGPFLNIPIKRLSSGMAMRLAFSVAAHLSPDILLIDEALSVGDANFQKKCVDKMRDFVASGATVIFVTHDLALVNKWCKRVLLLDKGRLIEDGPASAVIPKYLQQVNPLTAYRIKFEENPLAEKAGLTLTGLVVNSGEEIRYGQALKIDVAFRTLLPMERLAFSIVFSSLDGAPLVSFDSDFPGEKVSLEAICSYTIAVALKRLDLNPGSYVVSMLLRGAEGIVLDERHACLRIEVLAPEESPASSTNIIGGTRPAFDWTLSPS